MAFGMLPSEVLDLPAAEYEMLMLYWNEEPWGPWRDNLHAAIMARATLQSQGGARVKIDDFFYRYVDVPAENLKAKKNVFAMFKAMAKVSGTRKPKVKKR